MAGPLGPILISQPQTRRPQLSIRFNAETTISASNSEKEVLEMFKKCLIPTFVTLAALKCGNSDAHFCLTLSPPLFSSLLFLSSLPKMDHDPRNPTYISSQGPLPTTVADFWQVELLPSPHFDIRLLRFTSQQIYLMWLSFHVSVCKSWKNRRKSNPTVITCFSFF